MLRPAADRLALYEKVRLPSRNAAALVRTHGTPHYIKIDFEGFDGPLLRTLFENDIRPPFISAESHTIDVFCLLAGMGGYGAFKLVDGRHVEQSSAKDTVMTRSGARKHTFVEHSAGPFGEDVKGQWACAEDFFQVLAVHGLGWKDIHATSTVNATISANQSLRKALLLRMVERRVSSLKRRFHRWRAILS